MRNLSFPPTTMNYFLRCSFRPQAWGWGGDALYEVEPLGETEWMVTVDTLPQEQSYESDNLRYADNAPQWCRDWAGPFEVDYTVIENESYYPELLEA